MTTILLCLLSAWIGASVGACIMAMLVSSKWEEPKPGKPRLHLVNNDRRSLFE